MNQRSDRGELNEKDLVEISDVVRKKGWLNVGKDPKGAVVFADRHTEQVTDLVDDGVDSNQISNGFKVRI